VYEDGLMATIPQMRRIRIFLSSPGDVTAERKKVWEAIEKIGRSPLIKKQNILLEFIAWDDPNSIITMSANKNYQQAVDAGMPQPHECEIVVVIFWGRMGTPLDTDVYQKPDGSPYWSGTEREYFDALVGTQKNDSGLPIIYLYRRMDAPPAPKAGDKTALRKHNEQRERLEDFFVQFNDPASGANKGIYHEYEGLVGFEERIERDLEIMIGEVINNWQAPIYNTVPQIPNNPITTNNLESVIIAQHALDKFLANLNSLLDKHASWNEIESEISKAKNQLKNYPDLLLLLDHEKSSLRTKWHEEEQRKNKRSYTLYLAIGVALAIVLLGLIAFILGAFSDESETSGSQKVILPSEEASDLLPTEVVIIASGTPSASPTSSESPTESPSPTNTESPIEPPSPTSSPSATEPPSPTANPSETPTITPSPSATPTVTPSPSETPSPTASFTVTIAPQPNTTTEVALGLQPVSNNTHWNPLIQEFDGVLMALVPVGCFTMGSTDGQPDEQNGGVICFEQPFWIDVSEVTQGDFIRQNGLSLLGDEREFEFPARHRPVENISWYEARLFCESRRAGRLPTEAEWEYAARGPSNWVYPWGDEWIEENGYAIWTDNANFTTAVVGRNREGSTWINGRYAGASWVGALDMAGNVSEWTSSQGGVYPYTTADGREDWLRVNNNSLMVVRGGAWTQGPEELRAANRDRHTPDNWAITRGFRCVRDYPP
jgi:formylglycine-generating enzyme required for sulfatase activity